MGYQNASTWINNDTLDEFRPTEWSMWYNDQDKDMSIAQTADELQASWTPLRATAIGVACNGTF